MVRVKEAFWWLGAGALVMVGAAWGSAVLAFAVTMPLMLLEFSQAEPHRVFFVAGFVGPILLGSVLGTAWALRFLWPSLTARAHRPLPGGADIAPAPAEAPSPARQDVDAWWSGHSCRLAQFGGLVGGLIGFFAAGERTEGIVASNPVDARRVGLLLMITLAGAVFGCVLGAWLVRLGLRLRQRRPPAPRSAEPPGAEYPPVRLIGWRISFWAALWRAVIVVMGAATAGLAMLVAATAAENWIYHPKPYQQWPHWPLGVGLTAGALAGTTLLTWLLARARPVTVTPSASALAPPVVG